MSEEVTSNISINCQVIGKMISEQRIDVISKFGLTEEHMTDPVARNIYKKILDYYNGNGQGTVPSADALESILNPEERELFFASKQTGYLTDEELRDRLWEDFVYHKTQGILKHSVDLMNEDAVKAVSYLQTALTPFEKNVKPIGSDIVHNPDERLAIYKEKQSNTSYFYPTGFPQLDDKIGGLAPGEDLIVLFARTGVGKEQPLYSKILTPCGWTTMENIKIGDRVITGNGNIASVIGIFPQGIKNVYHVKFEDGTIVDAGIDHLWEVVDRRFFVSKKPKVVTTRDLLKHPTRYAIKAAPRFDIITDDKEKPYFDVLLSAIWSSRWKMYEDNDGIRCDLHLVFGTDLSGIIRQIKGVTADYNEDGIISSIYWQDDCAFGEYASKFITVKNSKELSFRHNQLLDNFCMSTFANRMSIVSNIVRTWGSVSRLDSSVICGVLKNKRMYKSFRDLIRSVGGSCIATDSLDWDVHFMYRIKLPFNPFLSNDKRSLVFKETLNIYNNIQTVTKQGRYKCQCIMLDHPDHTYITDSFTVTHNTWIMTKILHNCWRQNLNVGLIEPEMSSIKIGYRFDTLNKHFSNKDLMFGRRPDSGPSDYDSYIKGLPESNATKFMVAHPKEFQGDITVSKIKQWCIAEDIKVLGIDGISYIKDERSLPGDNTTTALTHISADLMEMSILLGIPVLIVVQSNREGTAQGGKLALENIRDSDGIAYSASKVLGLYKKNDALHIQLLKNRDSESDGCLVYDWNINAGEFSFIQEGEVSDGNDSGTHSYSSGNSNSNDNSRNDAPQRPYRGDMSPRMQSDDTAIF